MARVRGRRHRTAPEGDLLAWARDGDEAAFAELVERSRKRLFAVCVRITGDEHSARDAAQNALLDAWRALPRFEGRSSFSTWLCQIGGRAALAVAQRRRPDPVEEVPEPAGPFSDVLEESVTAVSAVRWALEKLPPDFRQALVLREYADLSYQEIAEVQGIPVETVKTRINRARRAVAHVLEAAEG
ncbi:MAG TPA: sigma-70 family RNA polymerase sigma factor [Acidimicrobiales bacterium]|nr:sigma-70 family RNA polymerase sigma factor [Acidimicrobiales bacterium]